jgi:hypothetical protein
MGRLDELRNEVADRRLAPPDDSAVEKDCPFLWEMLTSDRWGDNSERVLPTITISRVPGGYRAVLTDDSLWIRKGVVCGTLEEVPRALERALNDSAPWERMERSFRNKKGPPIPEEKKGGRRKRS